MSFLLLHASLNLQTYNIYGNNLLCIWFFMFIYCWVYKIKFVICTCNICFLIGHAVCNRSYGYLFWRSYAVWFGQYKFCYNFVDWLGTLRSIPDNFILNTRGNWLLIILYNLISLVIMFFDCVLDYPKSAREVFADGRSECYIRTWNC